MSLADIDTSLAEHANRLAVHHDGLEDVARAYASVSEALFVGLIAVLLVVAVLRRRPHLAATAGLALASAGLALVVAHAVSVLANRPRPFVDHPQVHVFVHHAADASFPSDHATAAFAIAGVLVLRNRGPGLLVMGAASMLAVSRVLIGLHYPGDVLAGAALGLAAGCVVHSVASTARVRMWAARIGVRLGRRAAAVEDSSSM